MNIIITSTYKRCSDGELVKITNRILDKMKNNAGFANPIPALADIEKARDEYQGALNAAGGGDRALIAVKNNKKAALRALLTQLAHYVSIIAQEDRALYLASGFDIAPERGSVTSAMTPIESFQIEVGGIGEATIQLKKVPGARSYVYQYSTVAPEPGMVWVSVTTTSRKHQFSKLASGTRHWFRVVAIGGAGQEVYSEPVVRIVQ